MNILFTVQITKTKTYDTKNCFDFVDLVETDLFVFEFDDRTRLVIKLWYWSDWNELERCFWMIVERFWTLTPSYICVKLWKYISTNVKKDH